MVEDDIKQFLKELSDLSRRTGVTINSCGCCGGMYLEHKDRLDSTWNSVQWDGPKRGYWQEILREGE